MRILYLTLFKKWFDAIASGEKKEEYRDLKPYWAKRLEGKEFDEVHFKNGYGKNAPIIRVKCNGILKGTNCYIIKLGDVEVKP